MLSVIIVAVDCVLAGTGVVVDSSVGGGGGGGGGLQNHAKKKRKKKKCVCVYVCTWSCCPSLSSCLYTVLSGV